MGLDLENVPKWPDFVVERMSTGSWRALTNTGRPKTPIFNQWLSFTQHLTEGEARDLARQVLDEAYRKAHPHGCPGSH